MTLRFAINDEKALEALTLVAGEWPGITPFHVAKVFFYAEKWHLNRYGRPIVGDTYVAMKNGPVPSAIYDIIKGEYDFEADPDAIHAALAIDREERVPRVFQRRLANEDLLSGTDIDCLKEAVAFCKKHNFGALSDLTHREASWRAAWELHPNSYMDSALMVDEGPDREATIEAAREFARFGVL